jgi:hypothetical protein
MTAQRPHPAGCDGRQGGGSGMRKGATKCRRSLALRGRKEQLAGAEKNDEIVMEFMTISV